MKRHRGRLNSTPRAAHVERLEERVVLAAYDLFNFAKGIYPQVNSTTFNVTAEGDKQAWAQGQGGAKTTFVTQQPVTIRQSNVTDLLKPANLYAPSGAIYDALTNKLTVDSGPVYLAPNYVTNELDDFVRAINTPDRPRSVFTRQPYDRYDAYTNLILNKDSLPPSLTGNSDYLSSLPTSSNRQILDIDKIPTNEFRLAWNNGITDTLKKSSSAEDVQAALNAIINNNDGFVTVTDIDSVEGPYSSAFMVTFGGPIWFNPPAIQLAVNQQPVALPVISSPAKSLLLSAQNSGNITIDLSSSKIFIPNGFASPLLNVESFVPTEVSYTSSYYPSYKRPLDFTPSTIGVRALKGAIETSAIAGQFQSSSAFNAIETLLGYRVIDIGTEYQLNPVNDPSGNPQPISAFTLTAC